jgi:hypothetical protein
MSAATIARSAVAPETARRRWGVTQLFALCALPVLALEIWTLVRWASDGPHEITRFRAPGHPYGWWTARIAEAAMILGALWVIRWLVRDCRRQQRILTFDVMFCLTQATTFWASGAANFFQPMFGFNSYLVNVNDPCGNIPGVSNPACGADANPVLLISGLETFLVLACAILLAAVVRRMKVRWPSMSTMQTWAVFMVGGMALVLLEPLAALPLHLWDYPGAPISITVIPGFRYPLFPEIAAFGLYITIPAGLRYFRDDRGRTLIERNLDGYAPRVSRAITLLAMYFIMQAVIWMIGTAPDWPLGFHQQRWTRSTPVYIVNGQCDVPGLVTGTRYGPCPGSPGFKMPLA